MRQTIARIVLLLALTSLVSGLKADPPEKPPQGMGKYLIVLWEPGSPVPGKSEERIPKVAEPDIAKLGGRVLSSRGNQRLVFLPFAAVKQLRRHQAVGVVQRIWTGEPFSDWNQGQEEVGNRLRGDAIETDSDPLTWEKDYSYDAEGNITQIGGDTFSYDNVGRLKQMETNGAVVETYVYDGFGNLIEFQKPGNAAVAVPVDESTNRMVGHTYDEAGNVTSRKEQGSYEYDPLNMLAAYRTFQSSPRRLLYDANDERIATLTGWTLERWLMRDLEGQVLREYRANNEWGTQPLWVWEQDHIRGEGQLIAGETIKWSYWDGESAFEYGGKRHYHLDHLGSVRVVTDESGRAISENDFYPFGKAKNRQHQEQMPWGLSSPHEDGMRFAGHWRDFMGQPGVEDDLYLDYMHARHYDPNLGRFLSVDPVIDTKKALRAPQVWNRYSYVMNNPVLYNDPTGKIAATTAGIDRDLKDRGLTDERDALVKYARTLSAQVKAGTLDSKKAVDMYWGKAKSLTGADKNTSYDRTNSTNNALLVATGAALAIRGSVGNAMTRGSMGQDTLHHFFFNAYNSNAGIPAFVQAFGSNVVLPTMRERQFTVESDALDRRANVLGAEFGSLIGWGYIDLQPSQVNCPSIQSGTCQ